MQQNILFVKRIGLVHQKFKKKIIMTQNYFPTYFRTTSKPKYQLFSQCSFCILSMLDSGTVIRASFCTVSEYDAKKSTCPAGKDTEG